MQIPPEIGILIDRLHSLKEQQAELPSLLSCTHELYQQLLQAITAQHLQASQPRASRISVIAPERPNSAASGSVASAPESPSVSPLQTPQPTQPTPLLQEINERIGIQTPSLNERLKQPATELAEKLSHTPIPDLRKAIGINDRFLFLTELFQHDQLAYEQAIETLNRCASWEEAHQWITDHLQSRYQWQIHHPAVQAFFDTVKKRFSTK
ncbi:MAG: hypothetical protein IRZ29_00920 [Thermoflavifilum sp.]|nr:hypothetical protein [Thermoflavifilum sp.]